jgi:hypothetical protein
MNADLGDANHHAAIAFSRLRFLSPDMKELMRKEGIWEDLVQEMYAAAWEAFQRHMNHDETCRCAARYLYHFLKAYGFHRHLRHWLRLERPFSRVFPEDINDRGIAPRDYAPGFITVDDDHLEEKITAYLRQHPEGMSRSRMAAAFQAEVKQVEIYLKRLMDKGLVVELRREGIRGRPPTPLFVATGTGKPLPKPRMVAQERDERIRRAYLIEGKSIKRIKREFHHDKRTIRAAIGDHRRPERKEFAHSGV